MKRLLSRPILLSTLCLGFCRCGTTEQMVEEQIEILATNEIESEAWNGAVEELVAVGRPAARQLIGLLAPATYRGVNYREFRDEIEKTRTGAAVILGRIKHKAASASIDDILGAYRYPERIAGIRAIGNLGFTDVAVTALKIQLADPDPVINLYAASALVKMNEFVGSGKFGQAITGGDADLAAIAVAELASSNYFGAPLLAELSEVDSPYRSQLREALEIMRIRLVAQLGDDDPEIRRQSARALGTVGDDSVVGPLRERLNDKSTLVRFNASSALSQLGDLTGTDFLFEAMGSDDPVLRVNAIKSLVEVQTSSGAAESRLIASLGSDDPSLRAGAAQVFGQVVVDSALEALLKATADKVPEVRWSAIIALGRMGAPESREPLEKLAKDENDTVAYYAEWALQQLGAG